MTFFSVMAILATGLLMATTIVPAAYAETTVSLPEGSAVPGCEETDACYIPSSVNVGVGETVTWSNDDTAAHTVTSGNAADGVDGIFDSSLFAAGTTFSHTFEDEGTFDYFCLVHPWMVGNVVVGATAASAIESPAITVSPPAATTVPTPEGGGGERESTPEHIVGAPSEEETTVTGMTSDGSMRIEITASNPAANEAMTIDLKFRDANSAGLVQHANYDIVATQNGQEVLSMSGAHEHEGEAMHTTAPLTSEDAVDIEVTLLGFGLPDDEANWTGPTGEIIYFNVVPEFGTIAMMVLAVAIISIVAVSAKSRLSVMPRL